MRILAASVTGLFLLGVAPLAAQHVMPATQEIDWLDPNETQEAHNPNAIVLQEEIQNPPQDTRHQDGTEVEFYDGSSPLPSFEEQKYAVLQTLDKVTARTETVTLPIGKPSAVGPVFAEVKTCQKTPPTEQPEAAAFIQVWEAKPKAARQDGESESQWVFSGWMFASSPALSAMDHPIYDVWLKDCISEITPKK